MFATDRCVISVGQFKVRFVPFKDISPGLVLREKKLWTKESHLESRQEISLTFEDGDTSGVIKYLVAKATSFMGNELSCNAIHGKGHTKVN
jgi:hypothetical protein